MPHILLEYTPNLTETPDFAALFASIHESLEALVGIKLDNCKSRVRVADNFYIGDGSAAHAFVHLEIRFVEGRSRAVKQALGAQCLALLQQVYGASIGEKDLQITVEVDDIIRDFYFKYPEGSLTPQ